MENFASRYQSVLVPTIFVPWAKELIRRVDMKGGERVLDLGCGTGVVSRQIAEAGLVPSALTGVDHNPDMLDVARALFSDDRIKAQWIEADAAALPFDDDAFDVAFCQQALQFFPDCPAALKELRRVMKPGGRVVFCVQKGLDLNPMLRAQASALDAYVGEGAGAAVRAICSLPDEEVLRHLFEDAGFRAIDVDEVTLELHHPDARAFAAGAMGGMHTGDKLSGLADSKIDLAIDAFLTGLGELFDGTAMRFPHVSNVVVAEA